MALREVKFFDVFRNEVKDDGRGILISEGSFVFGRDGNHTAVSSGVRFGVTLKEIGRADVLLSYDDAEAMAKEILKMVKNGRGSK